MISALVCEIALVEVTDSADVDTVKAIFQARIDSQVGTDDAPGGAWYPASIETWKDPFPDRQPWQLRHADRV